MKGQITMISASAHDRFGLQCFGLTSGQAVLALAFATFLGLAASENVRAEDAEEHAAIGEAATAAESQNGQRSAKKGQSGSTKSADEESDGVETQPMIRHAMYMPGDEPIYRIGATTVITEVTTGLPFPARVDTGATTCSIHCEEMEIEDAAENAMDNIGKPIRFRVTNDDGAEKWINATIIDRVVVRTSEEDDERYKVRLKLRWQDIEKRVLVTLNDRERMKYPLLLGRNFLSGDFVVDVGLDGDE